MFRILLVLGAMAGFAFLLNERSIIDPGPIVWVLPAACATAVALLWQ